jgi:hypothetical protein
VPITRDAGSDSDSEPSEHAVSGARPDAVMGTSSTRAGAALELVDAAARSAPLQDKTSSDFEVRVGHSPGASRAAQSLTPPAGCRRCGLVTRIPVTVIRQPERIRAESRVRIPRLISRAASIMIRVVSPIGLDLRQNPTRIIRLGAARIRLGAAAAHIPVTWSPTVASARDSESPLSRGTESP